jgi:subtilase family serine protease
MVELKPYLVKPNTQVGPSVSRPFLASDMRTIYNYPAVPTSNVYVGIISLGGTLTGTIHPVTGILTGGDVQEYWTSLGIAPSNHPIVKIVLLGNSMLDSADIISTSENTLNVEMIGACCPTSKLTIIVYLYNQYRAPVNVDAFYSAFNTAINTLVSFNGTYVKPSIISCSWGASENLFGNSILTKYDTLFGDAKAAGITITCAAGNNGSSNGTSGTITDFPSSSPNVISCGGTRLVCPNRDANGNYIYTGATETSWSLSGGTATGGGVSNFFSGPPFPRRGSQKRQSPDIALVADPATGVQWRINGANVVYGGTSIVAPAIAGLLACTGSPAKSLISKLYALPSNAFNDILIGTNGAYSASTGYDNCSGLGSINGIFFAPSLAALVANPVTRVSITGNLTVVIGASTQLTAITNSNATNKSVTWYSSANNVSSLGLVTGISLGSAIITATTLDGFFTSSVTVTVTNRSPQPPPSRPPQPQIPVMNISTVRNGPSIRSLVMRRNTVHVLFSNLTPTSWTSSNPSIVTVKNGIMFARIFKGTVTIMARSGPYSVSVLVTVQ